MQEPDDNLYPDSTGTVVILEFMYDDGEHEPHVAECAGVFANTLEAAAYMDKRFHALAHYRAERHNPLEQMPAWNLVDRHTGEDSDLVALTRAAPFYGSGALE